MKKLVVTLMLVAFAATVSFAADSVVYPAAKKGNQAVTFNHKAHGEKLGCDKCHPAKVEKKAGAVAGKAAAHGLCLECHKEMGAPKGCGDCHKK